MANYINYSDMVLTVGDKDSNLALLSDLLDEIDEQVLVTKSGYIPWQILSGHDIS
ncbi:MAG: hypothetical protein WBA93_13445 [Microcoleaceae cyanobacterium]